MLFRALVKALQIGLDDSNIPSTLERGANALRRGEQKKRQGR